MNYCISLTTVPQRVFTTLPKVIKHLNRELPGVVVYVNIPNKYRNLGKVNLSGVSDYFENNFKNIHVNISTEDLGPIEKIMGVLRAKINSDYVLTVDDDVLIYGIKDYVDYLNTLYFKRDHVITSGGIYLNSPPYKYNDGLRYNLYNHRVHGVAGYKSVLYPVCLLKIKNFYDEYFRLYKQFLLEGVDIFTEDDAAIGITLTRMGVPIYSVPFKGVYDLEFLDTNSYVESQEKDRINLESSIYNIAKQLNIF